MRITDENGLPETRYFPVIAIDDSGHQKVALFPAMSADQFKSSGKPYLEEVMPHIYHLHGHTKSDEIACPCCGKQMEHYYTPDNAAMYLLLSNMLSIATFVGIQSLIHNRFCSKDLVRPHNHHYSLTVLNDHISVDHFG